jgi:HSP20 family protein
MTLFLEPFAFELARQVAGQSVRSYVPAVDVLVTDGDVTVVMDVPGLTADDLAIELQEDMLAVRGERPLPYQTESDKEHGRQGWQHLERGFGKFQRVLQLPKGLDPDAITASLSDGVLTLQIPKREERKPRRIEIATGQTSETFEASPSSERELAGSTA